MALARKYSLGLAAAMSALAALALSYRAPIATATLSDAPAALISSEHALVADYLRMNAEQRATADRAADAELARSRAQAAAQAAEPYVRSDGSAAFAKPKL